MTLDQEILDLNDTYNTWRGISINFQETPNDGGLRVKIEELVEKEGAPVNLKGEALDVVGNYIQEGGQNSSAKFVNGARAKKDEILSESIKKIDEKDLELIVNLDPEVLQIKEIGEKGKENYGLIVSYVANELKDNLFLDSALYHMQANKTKGFELFERLASNKIGKKKKELMNNDKVNQTKVKEKLEKYLNDFKDNPMEAVLYNQLVNYSKK
tara:strand:+ start:41 stop:679 length:639 start_codon:yes stop_codon:yes gene_type:complete